MTLGLLLGLFLFVLAAVTAAGYVFVLRPSRADSADAPAASPLNFDQSTLPPTQAALIDMFRLLGEAMPLRERETLRGQLAAAGYRWASAVTIFMGIKAATGLMLGALLMWLAMLNDAGFTAMTACMAGIGLGYLLPDKVLRHLVATRSGRLRRALPAALDLLVLAVEAGQGLDAAIADTSRGLRTTHHDLAAEFTQLRIELRTSSTRAEALTNFSNRCGDLELKKFAHLLLDTDRFGTSIGPALKTHARYLRIRFRQSAQERARKVGVKLIFPVFFLIFPSVILVTLGPAVIQLMSQLNKLFGM